MKRPLCGLDCLKEGSSRPNTIHAAFQEPRVEKLRSLLHTSPRVFDKPTSLWTLELAAEVSFEQGLTAERVTGETIRATLARLGVRWNRAKKWITSPDPEYSRKEARDRLTRLVRNHPEWALGFEDETWWSRLALPEIHAWTEAGKPLRLVERSVAKDDPDPKALACFGVLVRWFGTDGVMREQPLLRFVDGRPVSAVPAAFLE